MTTPLPPQDPREPDEKLPGEAELTALYRQLPQSEPSPALDAAVLRAAAMAADETHSARSGESRKSPRKPGDRAHPEPRPSPGQTSLAGKRKQPRWLIGLGSAATLVLAAGLAWHMRELPQPESAPTSVDSVAPMQTEAAAPTPLAAPMPPAEPPPSPQPASQPPSKMIAAAPSVPAAIPLRKAAAEKRAAPAADKGRGTGALSLSAQTRMAPWQPASRYSATHAAKAAAADMPAMTVAAPAPAAVADVAATTAPDVDDTPAQELEKIRQLFAQGHDEEAQKRLAAFRHAHPQWTLPPELRAKRRKP